MDELMRLNELLAKARKVTANSKLHDKLSTWADPPSDTETEKCERAVRMVKTAIDEDPKLSKLDISVYAKGSFANRTNIPSDSDVDIAVVRNNVMLNSYPTGKSQADYGLISANSPFADFRKDVFTAIENKFGKVDTTPSDKCITVHSNSCRVDADVVPQYVHRRYKDDGTYYSGVALVAGADTIYNWPQQDYDNGVEKNKATQKKYKDLVRIIKNIRSQMIDEGKKSANHAKSYLIACLVWNVPNGYFSGDNYVYITKAVLGYLAEQTQNGSMVEKWVEVNHMKWLFRDSQPWNVKETNLFLKEALDFVEDQE